jgi:hypothetical protein
MVRHQAFIGAQGGVDSAGGFALLRLPYVLSMVQSMEQFVHPYYGKQFHRCALGHLCSDTRVAGKGQVGLRVHKSDVQRVLDRR